MWHHLVSSQLLIWIQFKRQQNSVNQKQSPDPGLKQVWKRLATTMSPKTTPARTFQSKDMLESIQSFNKTEETKT